MEEICIGGGGTKGIAFLGALYELEKNDLINNLKKISGTSIGGFFALLLTIGFKPSEILTYLFKIDLKDIKDVDIPGMLKNKSLMNWHNIFLGEYILYYNEYSKLLLLNGFLYNYS